jgi:general L-amino acid transport system permease protein
MPAFLRNAKVRRDAFQATAVAVVVMILFAMGKTTHDNLVSLGIVSGFGFLERSTGWDIPFSVIEYSFRDPYWRVLLVGFLNTLVVGLISLVFATVLGTLIGVARISANPLLRLLGTVYVEIFRNVPLILQAFMWYAMATHLPPPRRAIELIEDTVFLTGRGIFFPWLNLSLMAIVGWSLAVIAIFAVVFWRRRQQRRAGSMAGPIWPAFVLVLIATVVVLSVGTPAGGALVVVPVLKGLRFEGGMRILPEFSALSLAISMFGAAYIAEIVRGGFNAVNRGQLESARALGLPPWVIMSKVHIPLALRVIVPPLGNQYVWLMKATTVGIAIGFSDLFMVVSTSINQSGQTIELLGLMMLGFFIINYSIASIMHAANRAIAIRGYEVDNKRPRAEL